MAEDAAESAGAKAPAIIISPQQTLTGQTAARWDYRYRVVVGKNEKIEFEKMFEKMKVEKPTSDFYR